MSAWDLTAALSGVRQRVQRACERAGRAADSVELVAVSKRHPPEAIRAAYALGQRAFGENYVQELALKARELGDLPELRWHLIGHLQRNKAKDVVRLGCVVQTLDSAALCEALGTRASFAGCELDAFIQVNVTGEQQKSGVPPQALAPLAAAARAQPGLRLRGLMTIPKFDVGPAQTRSYFRQLRELATELGLPELSMGMSDDFELAIEEGATLVRVGTAIFGPRA